MLNKIEISFTAFHRKIYLHVFNKGNCVKFEIIKTIDKINKMEGN